MVAGAGAVGLAVARALARRGREVVVLEAEPAIGQHASSRNSEVIHAGIYYPPGSLKARTCVAGRELLYEFCRAHAVPHARTGKLVVATGEREHPRLRELLATGRANGVADLRLLPPPAVAALEPAVRCSLGLLSPSSGIIDSHAFLLALQAGLEQAGGLVLTRHPVAGGRIGAGGIRLHIGGEIGFEVTCRTLVNAAGLGAWDLCRGLAGFPREAIPERHLAIGHYYALRGAAPFSRLVYPLPAAGGLGIHVTLDLAGAARFGPDVRWIDAPSYAFDDSRRAAFVEAIRAYYPALEPERLQPAYTGIRPKLAGPGKSGDFLVQTAADHGQAGLVNLFGIESPGLTAALALAERVAGRIAAD